MSLASFSSSSLLHHAERTHAGLMSRDINYKRRKNRKKRKTNVQGALRVAASPDKLF